jgi:hypothetical protein
MYAGVRCGVSESCVALRGKHVCAGYFRMNTSMKESFANGDFAKVGGREGWIVTTWIRTENCSCVGWVAGME